ncbi:MULTISPECIES: TonB-dependent receptor plug domain-containing protein [Sphingobacterium]|uniref:M56 family metallopeptidase n=1 Tax=Sphingobacterium TaxID=28453 RepID=UPI0013D96DF1|nr:MULTISPECIES: M56 family metallopeptidase [unclassified Sphingobacterium]
MESILTYILQVNLLLAIVFLGYVLLLRKLTFYRLNRVYLFVGGGYSLFYPFLAIHSWFKEDVAIHLPLMLDYVEYYLPEQDVSILTVGHLFLAALAVGAGILLLKLSMQLISLLRIHVYSKPSKWQHYFFRNVLFPIVPFSFFNKIYIHQDQHQDPELFDIFKHEDIHVKGLHTVDILLFEILLIGCWYNPFVWLMRKAVRQNLEFLTDQQVLDKGVDRQTYQYSLLTVTKQGATVAIGNQFNFKTLKKRIMMMNKRRSAKIELSKYAFLLPIVILAGASFTVSNAEGKIEELVETVQAIPVDAVLPISKTEQLVSAQDTLKDEIVGISYKADTLQVAANEKGFPIGGTNGDQLFIQGDVRFGDVLTVLDGVPVKSEEMKNLAPDDIESVTVLKDKSAMALYGDKGKNGVLLIVSKSGKAAKTMQGKVSGVRLGAVDTTKSGLGRVVIRGVGEMNKANPLFVIDGREMPVDFDLSTLEASSIHSISVLKDKSAESIYGTKGKEGVVIITTKIANELSPQKEGALNRTWTLSRNATKDERGVFYGQQQKVYKDDIKEVTVIGFASKDAKGKPVEKLDTQPEPEG